MQEILEDLHAKGWPLYILSDFPPCLNVLTDRFPAMFRHFKGMAVSFECRSTKGDKGLFAHLEKKHGLQAEKCVFIDDVPRLVENARSLGFRGIVFEDAEKLRAELTMLHVL